MIRRMNNPLRITLLLGMIGLVPSLALADEFRLESVTLPAPLLDGGKVDTLIEASGVEPIGDGRRLLVAHDKDPAALHSGNSNRPNFGRARSPHRAFPRRTMPDRSGRGWPATRRGIST